MNTPAQKHPGHLCKAGSRCSRPFPIPPSERNPRQGWIARSPFLLLKTGVIELLLHNISRRSIVCPWTPFSILSPVSSVSGVQQGPGFPSLFPGKLTFTGKFEMDWSLTGCHLNHMQNQNQPLLKSPNLGLDGQAHPRPRTIDCKIMKNDNNLENRSHGTRRWFLKNKIHHHFRQAF